jgi:hypothetical protein
MDLGYCWLIGISGAIAAVGMIVLLASKAEFYSVRAAYWFVLVGTTVLALVLLGGLLQHVLLQVRGR